jgi:hypothetical protein
MTQKTRTIPGDAISRFSAWALLAATDDARLNGLPEQVWKKWIPTLLRVPSGKQSDQQLQARLLEKAHELVPGETATKILELVDAENEQDGFLIIAKEMGICWDQGLGAALAEKANSPTLKPQILSVILEFLLQREHPGSREVVESLIENRVSGSKEQKSQSVAAAGALIKCTQDAGWATIWPLLKRQKSLGRQIIESLSHGHVGGTNFVSKLDEHELAEFYVWMVRNYPYAKSKDNAHFMGPVGSAAIFRDGILGHLKSRGTFAACDALRGVMKKLPQLSWLRLQLEEAESLARASTWSPVSPRDFLALVLDRDKRFVENGVQLVQVILESLDRLQLKLHEELPAAEDLWNTEKRRFTPKDEQQVADYIARHLREDLRHRGVIVNREVQIRRRTDWGRKGQRTDIHVDAVAPPGPNGDSDKLHAIVEVKGNWNAELLDAMETQLRDRYLRKNRCKNGLYLPIWFASMEWSDKDSRKKLRSRMALAEAQKFFASQAAKLSTDGYWIRSYVLDVALAGAEKAVKKGPSKKSVKQATAERRQRRQGE